jgi:hypothetical protein
MFRIVGLHCKIIRPEVRFNLILVMNDLVTGQESTDSVFRY